MSSSNVGIPTPDVFKSGHTSAKQLVMVARFVGFWSAVALPLVYLPLLSGGLVGWQVPTFVVLFALNVLALIVGHDYGRNAT